MNKWFTGVTSVEQLRKRYRELLREHHPDNENGSVEITQEINIQYDRLFLIFSKEERINNQSYTYDKNEENAFGCRTYRQLTYSKMYRLIYVFSRIDRE